MILLCPSNNKKEDPMGTKAVTETIDLQGEVCPFTLVKTKVALEGLETAQVLEVHLGNSESASNVPRTLDLEGHEILDIAKEGPTHWVIKIQKK